MLWRDLKRIDSSGDFDLVKEDKALRPCLLAFSHTCISQTHFLTSCLAKCFSAGEITVWIESDFIEWVEKADGKRGDEKRRKERWILFRWYTYNRHGLYLWLDCFFRGMRKVPFRYNTDIHSALYYWNLKAFSFFCVFVPPYRCAVDCRWFLLLLQFRFNGRQRLHFPLLSLPLSSERRICSTAKPQSPLLVSLSLSLCQAPIFSPSPWLVFWHLLFFWFSRHMLPHLSLSRQDLA